jgi:glycine hydroxymethyltransferase
MWTNAQTLAQFDPELNAAIEAERVRQEAHI